MGPLISLLQGKCKQMGMIFYPLALKQLYGERTDGSRRSLQISITSALAFRSTGSRG